MNFVDIMHMMLRQFSTIKIALIILVVVVVVGGLV